MLSSENPAAAAEALQCHQRHGMGWELLKQEPESSFLGSVCGVGLGCERWQGRDCCMPLCGVINFNLTLCRNFPFLDKLISAWGPGRQVPR